MPTYDYQCRSCGTVTEVIHSMLEEGPSSCERCGGELRRVLYPAGIIFKGSGFYRTDSRAGSASTSAGSEAGSKDAGGSRPKKDATPKESSGSESSPGTTKTTDTAAG